MKAITPNALCEPDDPRFDVAYIVLPQGPAVRVYRSHYAKHGLGAYRWYRGARGAVVATIDRDRRTVYLSRLLTGARPGERVALRSREPDDLEDGGGLALDYRPCNFRRYLCCGKSPT